MDSAFYDIVTDCPVIASVKDQAGLAKSLLSESSIVFILFGDVCSISSIVQKVKDAGKTAIVHMDLLTGLSGREIAVDYIKQHTAADGIITTRLPLIKRAKELQLYTILRFFVIDSMAFQNIERQGVTGRPDLIEILPGVMPKIISKVSAISKIPIIAGGLIQDKEDIVSALKAGAVSVSTTNQELWFM